MRRCALIIFLAVTGFCKAAPPHIELPAAAVSAVAASPEGLWRFGADGAVFTVVETPGVAGSYNLLIDESPDLTIPKGTLFGTMKATGTARTYEASLLSDPAEGRTSLSPKKVRHFIFTLSADGSTLEFRPYRKGKTVNILRWLPYLVRLSVTDVDTRPRDVDAATRLEPAPIPTAIII
ncbi:MAG: hypothetical protein HDS65_08675 [Bacteroidales bacterium]|nr:hypothetical protein [Bacteroidales bacterium]